jgi:peptide subunit release factor 1 (eRF1)
MAVATDPVERIRTFEHETPLALDLPSTLARLAGLPPSTAAPYLTVALDWQPEGTAPGRIPPLEPKRSQRRARLDQEGAPRRPSWEQVRRDLDELVARYGPRGAAFDSLSADVQRLTTYLEDELDAAAQGVVVVACQHQDLFEPVPLDIPVTTGIAVGPIPSLLQLVHAAEDFPPYAVLVADQREAILWLMERQTWQRSVQVEADDYPRKQQQGGWSQRRFQARADERVEAFAKTIAEEARRELGEGDDAVPYLIVAAEEPMSSALAAEFHQTVSDRIIGHITLPNEANDTRVAEAAEPLIANVERQREMEAVQAVRDGVGAGTLGVAGPADTLTALETGQVRTLVMNDDFSAPGWADYTLPLYGVGAVPRGHPAGGDVSDIMPTALEDEVIRLAIQTGATIELVRTAVPLSQAELEHIPDADDPTPRAAAAKALDELGGIGAILRFAIDENQNGDGPM